MGTEALFEGMEWSGISGGGCRNSEYAKNHSSMHFKMLSVML